jgi:hypothetical protein
MSDGAVHVTLFVLLLSLAVPARAEWTRVGETDDAFVYVDMDTVRREGDLGRLWQVHELKKKAEDGASSRRALTQYDCKDERVRVLQSSRHSAPKATGTTVRTFSGPSAWEYIAPNTMAMHLMQLVCKR